MRAKYDVTELEGDASRIGPALERARSAGANLILALGALAATAAAREINHIPVVSGLILSAEEFNSKPNFTCVVLDFPLKEQFQWMRSLAPECKNIGVLYNQAQNLQKVEAAKKIARSMGLTLYAQPVRSPSDIPLALESLSKKIDILWGIPDDMVFIPQTAKQILLFSFRNRIPLIGASCEWVKAGALYALEPDYRDIGAQCGQKAFKVLRGAKPGALAPQGPRKTLYVLNLNTAQYMKMEIKAPILQAAHEVYR